MSDSIKVAIKVRPLIKREKDDNLPIQWTVQENTIVPTDPEMRRRGDGGFCFDHIFDMKSSNLEVFNTVVKPIVNAAVNGFNGTVFAYGQTSSGKTFTMMGTTEEPGILPLAIEHMFDAITDTGGREFLLRVSYLEIYNERVNDLLNKSGTDLKLKEDGTGQVVLQCKEEITNSPESVLCIMKRGDKHRRIGETNMNERSSRSHTIFRITIESREAAGDSDCAIQVSQLNLVDLAGSERARQTGATGERFKEGRHINMSLTTLGLVIMQLSESQDGQKHVNFRDSKLTRLLQTSLGGNAMTAIICAVTPAALEETQCTLSFACRAKSVKNKPQINEVMSDATLLKRYAKQLTKLQQELEKVKNVNRIAEVQEMESKLQEKDRINQLLEERIELLKTRIVSGDSTSRDESFKHKSKRRQTWGGPGISNQHLPIFQHKAGLPTIKEVSFEKSHRKSVIQSMDIMNQTFQTAFTDFELELFESERDRDSRENGSDSEDEAFVTKRKNRVTFRDDVLAIRSKNGSFDETPEKCNSATQTASHLVSPSTPKHVLRRHITNLTREFVELREFTTLEKQIICEENQCRAHEKEGQTDTEEPQQQKCDAEYSLDVKERLGSLGLAEEKNTSNIITELCRKLHEIEEQNIAEKETNRKTMKKSIELEKQVENVTSERNEFEYMSCELRTELKKKTTELELRNMSEEIIKQEELKKISKLEKQVMDITSEKCKLERINSELVAESTKKITDLQQQIEYCTSERNEFEHMRRELHVQLNKKSLELEKLKNDSEGENDKTLNDRITNLEGELENVTSGKNEVERQNEGLRAELKQVTEEFEQKIAAEQAEKRETAEQLIELEKRVKEIVEQKEEHERVSVETNEKIADLELKVESERAVSEEAMRKLSELEAQSATMASEKSELEHINQELQLKLNQVTTEVNPETTSDKIEGQETTEIIAEEVVNGNTASAKDESECIITELRAELNQKASELELEQAESRKAVAKITELNNQLEIVTSERNQFEHTNNQLNTELNEKIAELNNQLEIVTTERNQFEHTNNQLNTELNEKITELNSQLEIVMSERNQFEHTNNQLNTELNEKITELNNQLEIVMSERNQFEHTNNQLNTELNEKITELTNQLEIVMSERNQLNSELNEKIAEVKSNTIQEQAVTSEVLSKTPKLEVHTDDITPENNKDDRPNEFGNGTNENNSELNAASEQNYISENNNLKSYIENLKIVMTKLQTENDDLKDQLGNQSILSYSKVNDSNADASYLIVNMEAEKSQLEENLQLKSQELDDIKNDVRSLKTDIKKLQDTIYLLTTENMEMHTKLTTEQENAKQAELSLQRTIDELYARISQVTNEKITLESDLASLNDQMESMRTKISTTHDEKEIFASYQCKIDKLTAENIELSTCIAERNKELENIKESKSLLYDHECIYKEKVATLAEENKCLLAETVELSSDLMEKIEENEALKEQCDILKSKVEKSLVMDENVSETDLQHLKTENCVLQTEIAELKTKVSILSEENVKYSNSLLEAMENLDSTRNEKSNNTNLHLSMILNNSTELSKTKPDISEEENRDALTNQVATLQNKIVHLQCLNKKLSELKLTSCGQCAHLRNLNESRRSLKLETKMLNRKLEDLQRKLDKKSAATESSKREIGQEVNSSEQDSPANVSFIDEVNVSAIEGKIQNLSDELQTLKADHEKLSLLYEDKCNELEQLQCGVTKDTSSSNDDSTPRKSTSKSGNRIEQIQNYTDQLRNDLDELKKDSTNFADTLKEYKIEKANLLEEINSLKDTNEELQQKVSSNETAAINKIQILENELNVMSKQIEGFSNREKEFENQRLMLEVELESIKTEQQSKNAVITELNEHISCLENEIQLVTSQKNELTSLQPPECEREELQYLRKQCEELKTEKEQHNESEQRNMLKIKEMDAYINELQISVTNRETVYRDFQQKGIYLEGILQEREQEKHILIEKLQTAEMEVMEIKNNLEIKYKNEFDSMYQQYQQHIKEYENNMQKLNETLNNYIDENLKLTEDLTTLRNIKEKCNVIMSDNERASDHHKILIDANKKLSEELNDIRKCLLKELRSLKYNVNSTDLSSKPVTEIFTLLLQTLVSKEEEIIKTVRGTYEEERQKLVEKTKQCIDAEKRATTWSKELEAEIEKLQSEITERERADNEYKNKITQLEYLLRESTHEKEMFREKMEALETDFNTLQTELDKHSKVDSNKEDAIIVAQKREREAQKILKSKEEELESKLKSDKGVYEQRINDLIHAIESYKAKNSELNSTIEGLEATEEQLKKIIEAKSTEIKRNNQNVEKINAELEQVMQAYNEVSQEVEQKNSHIVEITEILKNKCDTLSEYKSKLETIVPEYEMLKEHVKDKKLIIERCKEEIEVLKKEREEQLVVIKDKLNSEEIINAGLNKQLNELNNRNITLIEELNDLKEKYDELEQQNAKLERKIRNSTSKIKAEAEIEELKELNQILKNNFEGASNRVTDLQEAKNQTLKELVDLKGKYAVVSQENNELKKTLSSYKSKHSSSLFADEGKYDALLQEKNRIALELEGKKLVLDQKDKKLKDYANQIEELTNKNKELDQELDEYADVIRQRDSEISKLEDKLYSRLTENVHITELEEKLRTFSEENGKLRDQVEGLKMRLQMDAEEIKMQSEKIIRTLKKENLELQKKISEYKKQIEMKLGNDSNILKEISINQMKGMELESNLHTRLKENELPGDIKQKMEFLVMENSRLKSEIRELQMRSRVDMLNERSILKECAKKEPRNVAFDKVYKEYEEKCEQLKKKIRELELQLVSKNGKIATLEIQIQSENFPYQRKCKELEELILVYRNKNAELSADVRKLQRTVNDVNAWECDICRRWRVNRKDQACQTIPNNTIRLCSTSSGVVEDHVKIQKLEKEKSLLKDLCRSRSRQIKELEARLSGFEME